MSSVTVAEPDEVPARTRRVWLRSLTSRLVVGVVTLVVVLVALIGGTTYYSLRSFLNQRLDQQLESTISGSLQQVFSGTPEPGRSLRPLDVWAVAISTNGKWLTYPASGAAEPMKLTAGSRAELAGSAPRTPVTLHTTDGHELRVETTDQLQVSINGSPPVDIIAVGGL
ncbi:MAG: hypothetical protein QOH89_3276, partial [Pseudonocardiales bacterium]|nr:hypothetical protein [Pseudonocardiales bacterium]